jgi:hypothetical protein
VELEPAGNLVDCPILWAAQAAFPDLDRHISPIHPHDGALTYNETAPTYAAWGIANEEHGGVKADCSWFVRLFFGIENWSLRVFDCCVRLLERTAD